MSSIRLMHNAKKVLKRISFKGNINLTVGWVSLTPLKWWCVMHNQQLSLRACIAKNNMWKCSVLLAELAEFSLKNTISSNHKERLLRKTPSSHSASIHQELQGTLSQWTIMDRCHTVLTVLALRISTPSGDNFLIFLSLFCLKMNCYCNEK